MKKKLKYEKDEEKDTKKMKNFRRRRHWVKRISKVQKNTIYEQLNVKSKEEIAALVKNANKVKGAELVKKAKELKRAKLAKKAKELKRAKLVRKAKELKRAKLVRKAKESKRAKQVKKRKPVAKIKNIKKIKPVKKQKPVEKPKQVTKLLGIVRYTKYLRKTRKSIQQLLTQPKKVKLEEEEDENTRKRKRRKAIYKRIRKKLLVHGRDLVRKRKIRKNRSRIVRILRNQALKKKATTLARIRYYPLALFGLFLQNKNIIIFPPARKTFRLLKTILFLFTSILQNSVKHQCFWFSTLRQLFLGLFRLPGFVPKFSFMRQINLFVIKEFSFKHLNISYFKKLYRSRFLIFHGAFTAMKASISSFDRAKKIGVSFRGMYLRNVTAALVCNYIVHKLGQYFTIHEILKPVIFDLRRSPRLDGFKIVVAGRLTRKERAAFLIRKKGKLTLSKNDANIDYSYDFKIMRFGLVGVKVWFQVKIKKPCFYKFTFVFICMLYLIYFIRETQKNPIFTIIHIKPPRNPIRIIKRFMRRRGSLFQSLLMRAPSKIGYFGPGSPHFGATLGPNGERHMTQIDDELATNPNASHAHNVFTSSAKANKVDKSVTELTKTSETTKANGTPGKQYQVWKDFNPHITPKDLKHFDAVKQASDKEDSTFRGEGCETLYKHPDVDINKRFNLGKKEPKIEPKIEPNPAPKPEPKIEPKPAPKSVAKPVPKPELKNAPKPQSKPGLKSLPKPTTKPATPPLTKPAAKPAPKLAPKPAAKPAAKPVPKPGPKPDAKPAPKLAPKPVAKPAPKPVSKPVAKPAPKPATKSVAKPASKPATKPVAKSASKPAPKTVAEKKPKTKEFTEKNKNNIEKLDKLD